MTTPRDICIIGVGNEFRSDDGVGLFVARSIAAMDLPGVRVIDGVADGTDMLSAWQGAAAAFVIDCVKSHAEPGTIFRFDGLHDTIAEEIFVGYSTHAFSIPETIALGRELGQLPSSLVVYGIEAETFSMGTSISAKVANAAEAVIRIILDGLKCEMVLPSMDECE